MSKSYEEQMAELRRQYLADAVTRASYFAAAARALSGLGGSEPPLAELRQAAHRLAGSAGIYGLPQIGARARALDEALMLVLQEERPLDRQAVADLAAELARALQEAASA